MARKRRRDLLAIRPKMYQAGRIFGDLHAVTKGASGITKRLLRKRLYKQFSAVLRGLGL